jgi:CarD family transcriptional regulator
MVQKKKMPAKALSKKPAGKKKAAPPKSKAKSIATKSSVAKKTSKSVPVSKSAAKSAKSAPKAGTAKKPSKPAIAAKPVASGKPAPAKASASKAPPAGKAPVSKAAPVKVIPPKAAPQPAARGAVAAAKPASPQVKAPSQPEQLAAPAPGAAPRAPLPVGKVQPKPGMPKIMPPATPKDIAARTAVARNQNGASMPSAAAAAPAAAAVASGPKKIVSQRHGFKTNEFIVYPAHGVGRIVGIEEQEIAGMSLELFVIEFQKDKMTVRVPTGKLQSVGMRKLADDGVVTKAIDTLKGRARIKRTMWSRRAQEYEAKINSGDLISIAEVVRDLYRSETQPEQSYSERQLYEAALDRMAREIAAVEKLDERGAVQRITEVLSRSAKGRRAAAETETEPEGSDEAIEADVKAA